MKLKLVLTVCLFAALALAGCSTTKGKETTTHPGASTSPTSSTTSTTTVGSGPAGYPKTVQWDSCKGWETGFRYPPGKPPGATHDPNWTDPTVNLATTIVTRARDCGRVSWGPFERPVRIIYEQQDFLQVPESCQPVNVTGFVGMTELSSLWVNDSALANFLKQTYPGMPVYYSPMDVSDQTTGGLIDHVWTWGLGAQNKSQLNTYDDQHPASQSQDNFRLFWYTQEGVSFMDLANTYTSSVVTNARAGYGTFYPPMLWGYITQPYGPASGWEASVTMSGSISVFHDHQCKQPT